MNYTHFEALGHNSQLSGSAMFRIIKRENPTLKTEPGVVRERLARSREGLVRNHQSQDFSLFSSDKNSFRSSPLNLWRGIDGHAFSGVVKIVGLSIVAYLLLGALIGFSTLIALLTSFDFKATGGMFFGGLALLLIFAFFLHR